MFLLKIRAWIFLSGLWLLVGGFAGEQIYPNRWVRVQSGLRSDGEVERIEKIARVASEHGLTGIFLSAGLDRLDSQPPEYFGRLERVQEICRRSNLEIIPSLLSAGYGGAVLRQDRNLAAGIPVKDALFVVREGKARHVADPVVKITNGGFEEHRDGRPEHFQLAEGSERFVRIDREVRQEGEVSVRFQGLDQLEGGWVRLAQSVSVEPHRSYRVTFRVRTEDFGPSRPFGSGNLLLDVLGGEEKRPLQYQNARLSGEGEWQKMTLGFNSWDYDRVEIAPRVRAGSSGRLWLDGLQLEEVALVNVLRRPGTPVTVQGDESGAVYEEGKDYARIEDPQLNFRLDHDGPEIALLPRSRIREGERLRVSYYHGTVIYNGQTPICMSEPKVYEIWRKQIASVHRRLAPKKYLLSMDEVRAGGTCEACRARGMSLGEILGACITRQVNMIREVNPEAEVFVWSDMLDPNHNANPDREHYYLAAGGYAGSWKFVPKDLVIVCWNHRIRQASLEHFSSLGFRTMAGAYYDADDLENVRGWLEALGQTPGATGILYTTWLDKYDLLDEFGDLVSK